MSQDPKDLWRDLASRELRGSEGSSRMAARPPQLSHDPTDRGWRGAPAFIPTQPPVIPLQILRAPCVLHAF